jgi:hypothetical protein
MLHSWAAQSHFPRFCERKGEPHHVSNKGDAWPSLWSRGFCKLDPTSPALGQACSWLGFRLLGMTPFFGWKCLESLISKNVFFQSGPCNAIYTWKCAVLEIRDVQIYGKVMVIVAVRHHRYVGGHNQNMIDSGSRLESPGERVRTNSSVCLLDERRLISHTLQLNACPVLESRVTKSNIRRQSGAASVFSTMKNSIYDKVEMRRSEHVKKSTERRSKCIVLQLDKVQLRTELRVCAALS